MNAHLADALDEARRGLWRSAAESFALAHGDDPADPAPVLAAAVCRLLSGEPRVAVLLLETSPALRALEVQWQGHHAWLQAAARLACGDPLGAEKAAETLPISLWMRVIAHARLGEGDYEAGVKALLQSRIRPERTAGG